MVSYMGNRDGILVLQLADEFLHIVLRVEAPAVHASFKNQNDPSGRAVAGVHEQAYTSSNFKIFDGSDDVTL